MSTNYAHQAHPWLPALVLLIAANACQCGTTIEDGGADDSQPDPVSDAGDDDDEPGVLMLSLDSWSGFADELAFFRALARSSDGAAISGTASGTTNGSPSGAFPNIS